MCACVCTPVHAGGALEKNSKYRVKEKKSIPYDVLLYTKSLLYSFKCQSCI